MNTGANAFSRGLDIRVRHPAERALSTIVGLSTDFHSGFPRPGSGTASRAVTTIGIAPPERQRFHDERRIEIDIDARIPAAAACPMRHRKHEAAERIVVIMTPQEQVRFWQQPISPERVPPRVRIGRSSGRARETSGSPVMAAKTVHRRNRRRDGAWVGLIGRSPNLADQGARGGKGFSTIVASCCVACPPPDANLPSDPASGLRRRSSSMDKKRSGWRCSNP